MKNTSNFLLLLFLLSLLLSPYHAAKEFSVLGMSVFDREGERRWWKWFMPSFYKKHLRGMDVDFTPQRAWNDTSYCQVRFYGFMKKLGTEGYWDGGRGTLSISQREKPLTCYYMSASQSHVNIGHGSKHVFEQEQAAKQLMAFAVYCPLSLKKRETCEVLNTKTVHNEIRLYPVGWEKTYMAYPPYEYIISKFISKKGRLPLKQVTPNLAALDSFSERNIMLASTEMLVCTVQTFENEMSGPMLYMFALHYSKLGFQVVIYDRYGKHLSFVKELIDRYFVIYHPFTAYEIALPDVYNAEQNKKEKNSFKFFYHFEVNDKFSVADDTRLQDQDKMITFDTARVQYSSYRIFLALDSDELLVPDVSSPFFSNFVQKRQSSLSRKAYPPMEFKPFITRSFSEKMLRNTEETMIFRYAAAARTQSGFIHPKNISADGDMILHTSSCLRRGYEQRDILYMARCYSSTLIFDKRFVKFIDTQSTCAFHYLHNGCNLVSKNPSPSTTPDIVANVDFGCFCSKRRASVKGMFLLHLNHNNFCSKLNRRKDPDILQHGTSNPLLGWDMTLLS